MSLVEIRNVDKSFKREAQTVEVYNDLTIDFEEGSFTALMGPSGSGKSTLLNRVVGLADRMDHYPRQLSGGQEQRVAIARAIVADPTLILLDEPTGQLDSKSSDEVLELLRRLNEEFRKTVMMVTHDAKAADRAKTVLHLEKGVLLERAGVAT